MSTNCYNTTNHSGVSFTAWTALVMWYMLQTCTYQNITKPLTLLCISMTCGNSSVYICNFGFEKKIKRKINSSFELHFIWKLIYALGKKNNIFIFFNFNRHLMLVPMMNIFILRVIQIIFWCIIHMDKEEGLCFVSVVFFLDNVNQEIIVKKEKKKLFLVHMDCTTKESCWVDWAELLW